MLIFLGNACGSLGNASEANAPSYTDNHNFILQIPLHLLSAIRTYAQDVRTLILS
ncbi:MAG: hypothetical protein KME06_14825 [Kastovskya adunca ATA6-11-RM4]|nr:hypothetical protein [Kastovskya adunca ATA6-11-RM4]